MPFMLLLFTVTQAVGQGHEAPLRVMRWASLERPLLIMSTDTSAPGEAYVDGVRIRVAVEGDFRVYRVFHEGATRTLHVALDAAPRYAAFDPGRNRFDLLSPGVRVELEDDALLEDVIAASGATGGKALPDAGIRHRAVAVAGQSGRCRQRYPIPAGRRGCARDDR